MTRDPWDGRDAPLFESVQDFGLAAGDEKLNSVTEQYLSDLLQIALLGHLLRAVVGHIPVVGARCAGPCRRAEVAREA